MGARFGHKGDRRRLISNKTSRVCAAAFDSLRDAIRKDQIEVVAVTLGYSDKADRARLLRDEPTVRAGVVLYCATGFTGPVPLYISRLTGIDRGECRAMCLTARRAGIFGGGGVYAGPWIEGDPAEAMIDFVLDAMVVAGKVTYEGPRGPDRLYSAPKRRRR